MLLYWEFGSVKVWLRHKRLFGNHTNTTIWRFTWARQKLKSHATNRQPMLITIFAILRKLYCTALHQEWQLCHGYYCLALKSAYKILPKSLVRMNILGAQGIFGVRFTRLEHLGASAIRGCRQHAISLFLLGPCTGPGHWSRSRPLPPVLVPLPSQSRNIWWFHSHSRPIPSTSVPLPSHPVTFNVTPVPSRHFQSQSRPLPSSRNISPMPVIFIFFFSWYHSS